MNIRGTGNINDDRDTQREITDWDKGTQIKTGTCVSTDVMFVVFLCI